MELTPLDTELVRVDQALEELIAMGVVEAFFYPDEEGQPTRYRLTGRPGDEDEQEEEVEAPARADVVAA